MTTFPPRVRRRPIVRTRASRGVALPLGALLSFAPLHAAAQAAEGTPNPALGGAQAGHPWRNIGLGVGVMGAAFLLDRPARDLALNLQGGVGDDLAGIGHDYGDWKGTAPFLAGGGLLAGLALDGSRGLGKATSAFFGVFAGSMSNTLLNWTLGRSRPREERGFLHFDPFRDNASLGSGHTAYAFAIAAAVDEVTEGWWAIPFYAVATGTGLARIYGDRHWLSDVVAGGFLGLGVGRRATRAAAGWLRVNAKPGVGDQAAASPRIEPLVFADGVGVRLRF